MLASGDDQRGYDQHARKPQRGAFAMDDVSTLCIYYGCFVMTQVIHPNPRRLPSIIDVSGMTSWGLPAYPRRGPTNTRVIIRLSQLQQDSAGVENVQIRGKLPYNVPNGGFAVIIYGCGRCQVTHESGLCVTRRSPPQAQTVSSAQPQTSTGTRPAEGLKSVRQTLLLPGKPCWRTSTRRSPAPWPAVHEVVANICAIIAAHL